MVSHRVIKIKRKAQTSNTYLEGGGKLSDTSCVFQEWMWVGRTRGEEKPVVRKYLLLLRLIAATVSG